MNRREAMRLNHQESALMAMGITSEHAEKLRRIGMTLHRWHELECGDGRGYIERDDVTGIPYYINCNTHYLGANDTRNRYRTPDREKGARNRLDTIMASYPHLTAYVQGDPRGVALYILEKSKLVGRDIESCYSSQGIAVY